MKRLAPVFTVIAQLDSRLGSRKSRTAAIHGFYSHGIEPLYSVVHRVQVGVQQANESSPEQKIETTEGDYSCGIVKQRRPGFFYQAALFQQAVFHHVSQTLALRDFFQDLIQRSAP